MAPARGLFLYPRRGFLKASAMESPQHVYSVEYTDKHGDAKTVLIAGVNFDDAVARFKWHDRHQEIRAVKYENTLENW